uniref:Uncharacterized protein n=1 Tax=Anguilla anguilla TaxID=7936 RepID=A0A0E9Q3L6_ANGAN
MPSEDGLMCRFSMRRT